MFTMLFPMIADVDRDDAIVGCSRDTLRPTRFLSSCSNRLYFDPDAIPYVLA